MKLETYTAELSLLHEAMQEFADAYPEQASMLNLQELRDKDPYVERLLEGVAFLNGQIRERIEDDIPEISECLLNQLVPHLLRPYPSTTIMELTPDYSSVKVQEITRGQVVIDKDEGGNKGNEEKKDNKKKQQQACEFITTSDVNLAPFVIGGVTLVDNPSGGSLFKITLDAFINTTFKKSEVKNLRFYLHTDPALASMLYYCLIDGVKRITVESDGYTQTYPENSERLRGCHFDLDDSILPVSGRSFPGFRLLHDYFCCKEKYLFVELTGFNDISLTSCGRSMTLNLYSDIRMPEGTRLTADSLHLNCTPAVNLNKGSAEAIMIDHTRSEYPLIVQADNENQAQVYSVDEVTIEGGEKINSLYSFRHRREKNLPYYHISRRHLHKNRQLYFSLGGDNQFDRMSLSFETKNYNGDYPHKVLREGKINQLKSNLGGKFALKNILRPSPMRLPPDRKSYQWHLISHLSINYQTLGNVDSLKQLLFVYDWSDRIENSNRIAGIMSIDSDIVEVIRNCSLRRGIEFQITLNDNNYASTGDLYLFANVLHHFFCQYATLNTFIQTRVKTSKTQKEWLWQDQSDDKSPLLFAM